MGEELKLRFSELARFFDAMLLNDDPTRFSEAWQNESGLIEFAASKGFRIDAGDLHGEIAQLIAYFEKNGIGDLETQLYGDGNQEGGALESFYEDLSVPGNDGQQNEGGEDLDNLDWSGLEKDHKEQDDAQNQLHLKTLADIEAGEIEVEELKFPADHDGKMDLPPRAELNDELTKEEVNALLGGKSDPASPPVDGGVLSQEEVNALLYGIAGIIQRWEGQTVLEAIDLLRAGETKPG